jgi:hypothetical protein
MREIVPGKVFLGGQSYGGRQATMLTAEDRDVADGLVLLSYPLHAPKTPDKKRIEHLPRLHVPALFVHGTRDPFGTPEEMEAARTMIPAETRLVLADGAGHALIPAKASGVRVDEVATWIRSEFLSFFSGK